MEQNELKPKKEGITKFTGQYEFLSLEFPCKILYEDEEYATAAVLFYAMRADNKRARIRIARLSPLKARSKSLALPENPDYDDNREDYLYKANKAKFDSNPTLKALLIKTHPKELVNTVTHFDDWIGVSNRNGKGKNALGKSLMKLRDEYIAEAPPKPKFNTKSKPSSFVSKMKNKPTQS